MNIDRVCSMIHRGMTKSAAMSADEVFPHVGLTPEQVSFVENRIQEMGGDRLDSFWRSGDREDAVRKIRNEVRLRFPDVTKREKQVSYIRHGMSAADVNYSNITPSSLAATQTADTIVNLLRNLLGFGLDIRESVRG